MVLRMSHRRIPVKNAELTIDHVRALACPVLVVRGAKSNVITPEAAERFVQALRDGRLVTVADCGHNVHAGNTAGFLDAVGGFLEALGAR